MLQFCALRDPNRAILLFSAAEAEFQRIRSAPSPFLFPALQTWIQSAHRSVPTIDAEALKARVGG